MVNMNVNANAADKETSAMIGSSDTGSGGWKDGDES